MDFIRTIQYFRMLTVLFCMACFTYAAVLRMGVVIGNDIGLEQDTPLSFATRDAAKVHRTLVDLCRFPASSLVLLRNQPRERILATIREMGSLFSESPETETLFFVYYSGHGGPDALHVNGEKLLLERIKSEFMKTPAKVRIFVADACFSGSLIQAKGNDAATENELHLEDRLTVDGTAIITSSSAGEFAQESRDLEGSLFTHHFVSALRGGADLDQDRKITLWESYHYANLELRRHGNRRPEVRQTPHFDFDIGGSDDLVLSWIPGGQALLTLPSDGGGRFLVYGRDGERPIANVRPMGQKLIELALPRDKYRIAHQAKGTLKDVEVDLFKHSAHTVSWKEMRGVPLFRHSDVGLETSRGWELGVGAETYRDFPQFTSTRQIIKMELRRVHRHFSMPVGILVLPPHEENLAAGRFERRGFALRSGIQGHWRPRPSLALGLGSSTELWSIFQYLEDRSLGTARVGGLFADFSLGYRSLFGAGLEGSLSHGRFLYYDPSGRSHLRPGWKGSLAISYRLPGGRLP